MAALLAKFRIDFSDVKVIPDVTKRAQDATRAEFTNLINTLPEGRLFSIFFLNPIDLKGSLLFYIGV